MCQAAEVARISLGGQESQQQKDVAHRIARLAALGVGEQGELALDARQLDDLVIPGARGSRADTGDGPGQPSAGDSDQRAAQRHMMRPLAA